MEQKKVAVYVRCSTADQNTAMQLADLEGYAKARGWAVYRVYEDKRTGTNTNRPMFQEMLKEAKAKKFDVIAIWKLDRFARSLKDLVMNLNELTEIGVALFSLKDQIDLTTSAGRLMLHILGAFAQFEADIIKERVTAGVRAKIAKSGGKWGRTKTRDDDAIHRLRQAGLSVRGIAKHLGISSTSVMRALKAVPITKEKQAG